MAELDDERGDEGRPFTAAPSRRGVRASWEAGGEGPRSEADWIVGMNATRAATIRFCAGSFDGAVSLGARADGRRIAIHRAPRGGDQGLLSPSPYWLVDAALRGRRRALL